MKPLRNLAALVSLVGKSGYDRGALRRLQERKLRRVVEHAYRTVPFYRERWDRAGVTPGSVRSLEDLARLPIVSKREMQAAGPDALTSRAFEPAALVAERTSGSSGRPFTVRFEARWLSVRSALFVRALWAAGYRPGSKLLMLGSGERRPPPRISRWRSLSYHAAPGRILDELDRFRPDLLYGWVTPLRQLAVDVQATGRVPHAPRAIVTTAETLDAATRRLLEGAFATRVFELYGLTEMGTAAWQCPRGEGFHFAEDVAIPEFPDASGAEHRATRLVMTNLELRATPFIRFETGDLAVPAVAERCACGRSFARMQRVEGRLVDCVRLRDGRVVSPFQLTLELERVAGLERYQVVQDEVDRFTVRYEGPETDRDSREREARRALERVLGADCRVALERHASLDPPPGRKFRVVESRVAAGDAS
jgi:phenylacetate-CoA ligase